MTAQEFLSAHAAWLDWAGEKPCGVVASLSQADLSDADLRDADLRDANLRDAKLRGADLSDANLSRANLSEADLSDANLSRANLSRADLFDANLRGAKLPAGWECFSFSGLGSERRLVNVFYNQDLVFAGCFRGTMAEFRQRALAEGKMDYVVVIDMISNCLVKREDV